MSKRDNILPAFDRARTKLDTLGLRRYAVATRRRTWSGGRKGLGTATTADTPLVPTPRVRQLSTREIAASGGKYQQGDFRIDRITPAFAKVASPVTRTGTGAGTVTPASAIPATGVTAGSYAVRVLIALGGAPGTATFQYSTDGGATYSAAALTPVSPATFQVPGLGLALAFAGAFVAADVYAFDARCGGYTPALLELAPATDAQEVALVLTGDDGTKVCGLVDTGFDRAFGYTLTVRPRRETP